MYNSIMTKINSIYQIYYLTKCSFFFLLILREIKTFLWAPKNLVSWTWDAVAQPPWDPGLCWPICRGLKPPL